MSESVWRVSPRIVQYRDLRAKLKQVAPSKQLIKTAKRSAGQNAWVILGNNVLMGSWQDVSEHLAGSQHVGW